LTGCFLKHWLTIKSPTASFSLLWPQYNALKEAVRAKLTRQPSRPDVEKIRKDVRCEVEEEFRKKINALTAASNQH